MAVDYKKYIDLTLPKNLTFDEESLFWRLKQGEGIPQREWHKPLDRRKSWHEIKLSLDKKLQEERTNTAFQKINPQGNGLVAWLKQTLRAIKISFLLID
jgi:hypothetical protein